MPPSERSLVVAAVAVGITAAAVAAAAAIGSLAWRRETERTVRRLAGTVDPAAPAVAAAADGRYDDLPAPVRRYLDFALTPGQRRVRSARLEWRGEFRLRAGGAWEPFTAEQHYSAAPPGFVWDAAIRMAPLVTVRVRDGYVAGAGEMRAAVAALVPVVNVHGTRELAAGALARFLGEAVWLPTVLLPGEGVRWTPVDDGTARATLTDGGLSVQVDFHFGPGGEVAWVSGERYRDVDGKGVLTPWRARVWDYERLHGMMVPRAGEVEWLLPEGAFAYWRGRLVDGVYGGLSVDGVTGEGELHSPTAPGPVP